MTVCWQQPLSVSGGCLTASNFITFLATVYISPWHITSFMQQHFWTHLVLCSLPSKPLIVEFAISIMFMSNDTDTFYL
jgi:hypothetical protein